MSIENEPVNSCKHLSEYFEIAWGEDDETRLAVGFMPSENHKEPRMLILSGDIRKRVAGLMYFFLIGLEPDPNQDTIPGTNPE